MLVIPNGIANVVLSYFPVIGNVAIFKVLIGITYLDPTIIIIEHVYIEHYRVRIIVKVLKPGDVKLVLVAEIKDVNHTIMNVTNIVSFL